MSMILVTGHKGYIGSNLFSRIGDVGIDLKDGFNLLTCDLPKNVHLIYHLAAQSFVESSHRDPLHDLDNIRITARLVKEYPNTKIIYASSAAARSPFMSPYGFSKWASGEYLKQFHREYVICVFPNIYGRNDKSVVDKFKTHKNVVVYGDGSQLRDYVHVDDIVSGLILSQKWPAGEYEMGSGVATSVLQLARGKEIIFEKPRKEAKESLLSNTTPNWESKISVLEYLYD